MPGLIRSPLDVPPPPAPDLSPPIIPGLTQLAPGLMRAVMRDKYGLEDEGEPRSGARIEEEPGTPPQIVAAIGKLFYNAGEYPGLQESILSMMKALIKAGQGSGVTQTTILRMPRPLNLPMPLPEEGGGAADLAPRPIIPSLLR